MSDYLRNAWYMAAWADELPDEGFLARTLLGRGWVLWRLTDGEIAMLVDRCPHRFAPLSKGERHGDTIRCGYHGLGFDKTGTCVHEPFGKQPPKAQVAALLVVEKDMGLWFWPGDPKLADPALIPDFAFCTGPDHLRDRFTVAANFEIITDNLMDLSHADFVHRESFGTNDALINCGKQTVRQDDVTTIGGVIWNNWDMAGAPPQEWQKPMLPPGTLTNQRLHMRWHAPATMALYITFENAASGEAIVPPMANPHIITPETQNSSHYFYSRGHSEEDEALFRKAFLEEDKPMLEAVHAALGGEDFWEARPLVLETDAGAIRARRRLMQLRNGEGKD